MRVEPTRCSSRRSRWSALERRDRRRRHAESAPKPARSRGPCMNGCADGADSTSRERRGLARRPGPPAIDRARRPAAGTPDGSRRPRPRRVLGTSRRGRDAAASSTRVDDSAALAGGGRRLGARVPRDAEPLAADARPRSVASGVAGPSTPRSPTIATTAGAIGGVRPRRPIARSAPASCDVDALTAPSCCTGHAGADVRSPTHDAGASSDPAACGGVSALGPLTPGCADAARARARARRAARCSSAAPLSRLSPTTKRFRLRGSPRSRRTRPTNVSSRPAALAAASARPRRRGSGTRAAPRSASAEVDLARRTSR